MSSNYLLTDKSAWEHPGDREKFVRLYQTYQSEMYQTAYSILLNHSMAEDAVQDACLKLIRHLDAVKEEEIARTKRFIKTIVQTTAYSMLKKNKKEFLYDPALLEESLCEEAASPETQFLKEDLATYLQQFIEDLKPKERDCIDLFYFHGQTTLQIAATLGISPAAVRKQLQRGREALRKRLKKEGLL